ncbi:unnamed protein product [Cyclocybe aegerita]|uniref:DUF6534 domain-containing protein n=1 Tax=Cyclocybe aegerita TaxID=1973307 RepID=A0A8S0XIH5_CYCAE|nr:unnamed protein product [Cyclocybe aegerita]
MEATIENTFGAIQIGSMAATFLFGIVTLQCHVYYSSRPKDPRILKWMVGVIWFLELTHTIFVAYEIYRTTITYYGLPGAVTKYPGFAAVMLLGGLITMLVQNFFALRVWKFLPRPYCYVGGGCIIASTVRCILSIYASVEGFLMTSYANYLVEFQDYLTALLAIGAAIDVINAGSLSYFLFKQRELAFARTTRLLDRLIAYTIRTGLITCIVAVTVLILFQTLAPSLISLAMYTALAKLYSNSFVSALNSRRGFKEELSESFSSGVSYPRFAGADTAAESRVDGAKSTHAIPLETRTSNSTRNDLLADGPPYREGVILKEP